MEYNGAIIGPAAVMTNVIPGASYTIKIVITDYPNTSYDSTVFLQEEGITSGADLAIEVNPTDTPIQPSEISAYQVVVSNIGPAPAQEVVVTNLFPEGVTLLDDPPSTIVVSVGAVDTNELGEIIWSIGELLSGSNAVMTLNGEFPWPGTFTNVASVTTSTGDYDESNNRAEGEIVVTSTAEIALTKFVSRGGDFTGAVDQVTMRIGTTATYWFVVANTGVEAFTNAVIDDALISFTHELGALDVSQSVTVSVERVVTESLTNLARVAGNFDGGSVEDSDDAVVLTMAPGMGLSKTVSLDGTYGGAEDTVQATNGAEVTYFFVVSNTGDVALAAAELNDPDLSFSSSLGNLDPGHSVTVQTTWAVSGSLTNWATATATDPNGDSVTATDDAVVRQIAPGIGLSKTVSLDGTFGGAQDTMQATNGALATYFFEVSNTGDVALANVGVVDNDLVPAYSNSIGALDVGQSVTVETTRAVSGSLTNEATAMGEDPKGDPVTAADNAIVRQMAPAIGISKTVSLDGTFGGSSQTVQATNGALATYFFVVTNTGDVDLTGVEVVDSDLTPVYSEPIGTLVPGQSVTVDVARTVSGSLTNEATATGADPNGDPVLAMDNAIVRQMAPGIGISKTVSLDGTFAASADTVQATNGATATYFFVVANTGDVDLTDVGVVDNDLTPGFTNAIGALAAGQSVTVQTTWAVSGSLTNWATATGTDPNGVSVTATDNAVVRQIAPGIGLSKTVSLDGTFGGSSQTVQATNGALATYFFVVSNTGDVNLTGVEVVDNDLTPVYGEPIGTLVPGQSVTVDVARTVSGSLTNEATATGADPNGDPVTATDDAVMRQMAPAIGISKTVSLDGTFGGSSQTVQATNGAAVTYFFVVSNTGDVNLTGVEMVDNDLTPVYSEPIGTLVPGQSVTVDVARTVSGSLTNEATATGTDPNGDPVLAMDNAIVRQMAPGIGISKTVSLDGTFAASADTVQATNGATATYFFVVANTGDVNLTDMGVVDNDLTPGFTNAIGALAAGQIVTVQTTWAVSGSLTNWATATGTAPNGDSVTATDDAVVRQIAPGIGLSKMVSLDGTFGGSAQMVQATNGALATFFFVVANTGDVDLSNVGVVDNDLVPAYSNSIGALDVGQSVTVETTRAVSGSLTNWATAMGEDPNGDSVTATDDAVVRQMAPAIGISKTVSRDGTFAGAEESAWATNGETVTYFFIVTNSGDVALENVELVDNDVPPGFTNVIGALGVGQSITVETTHVVSGSLTNWARATGEDSHGDPVLAMDNAIVRQMAPGIGISKTVSLDGTFATSADTVQATNGATVTYFFVVSNTGDVALDDVEVVDTDLVPGYTNAIGALAAGQSVTMQVARTVGGSLTNEATATGEDPNGDPVSATDDAVVLQIAPGIGLAKTVSLDGTFSNAANTVQATNGAVVTYFFGVSNTGDMALTNVVVDDSALFFSTNLGVLAVGHSMTVETTWVVSGSLVNIATATGEDLLGNSVSAVDSAHVEVGEPDVDVTSATWVLDMATGLFKGTLVVRNNGDLAVPADYDYWFELPVMPEWRLWYSTGTLPDGKLYRNMTGLVRTALRATGSRDEIWDPGEQITVSDLWVYHKRRVNPRNYVDSNEVFIAGRLFHSSDTNRNFVLEPAERDAAVQAWEEDRIDGSALLNATRLSHGTAYIWDRDLGTWRVLGN